MKITAINSFQSKKNNTSVTKAIQASVGINSNTDLSLMPHYNVSFTSQSRRVMLPKLIRPLTEKEAVNLGYTPVYDKEGLHRALDEDKKTILMADIDFGKAARTKSGLGNWDSIYQFSNELNGNGYKLKNFKNGLGHGYTTNKGLFNTLYNAVVKNLIIEDAYIQSNDDLVNSRGFGILADTSWGTKVENCAFSGKLLTRNKYTGGVIGHCEDTRFENIRVNVGIKTTPSTYDVPYTKKTIPIEHPSVPHTYQNIECTGALSGYMEDCSVNNCYADSQIKGWEFVGGIAGVTSNTKMNHCRVSTDLNGTAYVGGIVGTSSGSEFNDIDGVIKVRARVPEKTHLIGGFVGLIDDSNSGSDGTVIKNCNLLGSVSKPSSEIDKTSFYKDREDNRIAGSFEGYIQDYVLNCDVSRVKII